MKITEYFIFYLICVIAFMASFCLNAQTPMIYFGIWAIIFNQFQTTRKD